MRIKKRRTTKRGTRLSKAKAIAAATVASTSAAQVLNSNAIFLAGALLCDGSNEPQAGSLLIEKGRIKKILPSDAHCPSGIQKISLKNKLITPGLIDVHTHLFLPGEQSPMGYEKMLIQESLSFRALRGVKNAKLMLDFGFTTVRDVCTEGASYADVDLRDAINAGFFQGPRIYPSGPGMGITGGYVPSGLAPGICIPMGCTICDSPDAVRKEVRTQVSHGVSWIKVFADWPCCPTEPGQAYEVRPTFLRDELLALVDEAKHRGRRVAAHATSDTGARLAIECGVASIEHMGDLSKETLAMAADRNIFLVPTLSVSRHWVDISKDENKKYAEKRYENVKTAFSRALASGVSMACGTDIGCFPFAQGSLKELAFMCELGMKPLAALSAATRNAAKLLEKPDLGVLAEDAIADLCVFPFSGGELTASLFTGRPAAVVQNGALIRGTW